MRHPNIRTKRKVARGLRLFAKKLGTHPYPLDYTSKLTLHKANSFLIEMMFNQNIDYKQAEKSRDLLCDLLGEPLWKNIEDLETRRLRGFLKYGNGGKALHKYYRKYTLKLKEAASLMLEKYGGDPRKIWNNTKDISNVRAKLDEIPMIGPALANYAILCLARDYGLIGGKSSLRSIGVKPDVQLTRVFKRSGLVEKNATMKNINDIAKILAKDFPGILDPPAWRIGREWCRPRKPLCDADSPCPINDVCPKIIRAS